MGISADLEAPRQAIGRREVLKYGAFAGAAAAVVPASRCPDRRTLVSSARSCRRRRRSRAAWPPTCTSSRPGLADVVLPISGFPLQGLDVEPSVFTDYAGFSALAFHVGTATGSDGKRYDLETDMRAYRGRYVAADGTQRRGVYGFV